ncbi:Hint domain-containing protein [Paracoccus pacificus]|uniref:Hint domain-containing protein n=1 Tax=Paracoccus pacificus TaxID=1463598 RepID=A0ABW4R4L8_9RHOB
MFGAVNSTELRTAMLDYASRNNLDYNIPSQPSGFGTRVATASADIDGDGDLDNTAAFSTDGVSISTSGSGVLISLVDPTVTMLDPDYKPGQGNFDPFGPGTLGPPCLVRGTRIATPLGEVLVENLSNGDLVLTKDRGARKIELIVSTTLGSARLALHPELRPIRIMAGALGHGLPETDLCVSPQHRILVRSKIAQRMFGASEVLVAAKQLVALNGIEIVDDLKPVEYFHILFDQHEVVFANGAETESLYTGAEALKTLGPAARTEIFALFPALLDGGTPAIPARIIANGRRGRQLTKRHVNAGQPLI